MPRFTLSWLLMFTALVGIVVTFTQTEGCGRRMTMIESVAFSSDDSRILVSKLNARDARTPMKFYKADLARTVSWLDADDGRTLEVIRRNYEPENRGPADTYWRMRGTSVVCDPSNGHVALTEFGGGDLIRDADQAKPVAVQSQFEASNLAVSRSGRYFAIGGRNEWTVWDTTLALPSKYVTSGGFPRIGRSQLLFTDDESRLVIADRNAIVILDIATMASSLIHFQSHTMPFEANEFHDVAIAPDDTLIVCSDMWVRRYDLDGGVVAEIEQGQGYYLTSISTDGQTLAVANKRKVKLYDLDTDTQRNTIAWTSSATMALSSDGTKLAIGDAFGGVALADTQTAKIDWYVTPPGRYRWPWTIPAGLLVVWVVVGLGLRRRGKAIGGRKIGELVNQ